MITLSLFILISRNVYENFLWMKVNWYLHYFFEIQSVKLTKWKLKLWNWKRLSSSNRLFRRKKQVWDFMIYLFYCKYYCTSSPRFFWRDDNSKIQTVLPDGQINVCTQEVTKELISRILLSVLAIYSTFPLYLTRSLDYTYIYLDRCFHEIIFDRE